MSRKKRKLGYAFLDEIGKVTSKIGHFKKGQGYDWKDSLIPNFDANVRQIKGSSTWIITTFAIFCLIAFFAIFVKLFNLQIINGGHNRELADGNRIQVKIIHAPRGVIYDRNGRVLASNSPAFRLFDKTINKARLITREEALELEVNADLRVKDLEIDNVRTYPLGEKLAHVIGYVGEISENQFKDSAYKGYQLGDRVGQSGIEAEYEKILRGVDGGEIIEVDSTGQKLRTLRRNAPIPGANINLTIDTSLQEKVYQLVQETVTKVDSCCAAAVAMDPSNGQVLALLSYPSFDPNLFTKGEDERVISEIFVRADSPILNRSIAGTYPPGSTFKIVSSLAALSSGKIPAERTFEDNGAVYLGTFKFTNWYFNQYGRTEGPVNLLKALQRSNDIYYYEIAKILGEKPLIEWSRKLNLGSKLGIDLPSEGVGLVPDDAWKRKTLDEVWYPGDSLHMSIGQGFVLTTPLQVLGMTSFIASDGTIFKPQLVQKVAKGEVVISEFKPKVLVSNQISSDKINIIKQGLELVTKEGGTAWPFFTFPIVTAGKTGTAEFGDPKDKTHAWYTGYAPADDPKIVMTVLIEAGGEGSSIASPIVKEAFRWYFSEDKNKLIKDTFESSDSAKTLGE